MTIPVPFNDLDRIHSPLKQEFRDAMNAVMESGAFILGKSVSDFEEEFARYCQVDFSLGVSSGTDALLLALMALDIGPGDEVITTPFTFFATAGAIARVGATPVFADIEETTFNLAPPSVEAKITHATRAIIAVHLFGQCADMSHLEEIAARHNLALIEDAAQSVAAKDKRGKIAGSMGTIGTFSFFPAKNLGAFGDGGAVTTNNPELASKMRALRAHGAKVKYFHDAVGGNFRLDALQAAILSVKLPHLEAWTQQREESAARLRQGLKAAGLQDRVRLVEPQGGRHVYNQLVARVENRDRIQAHLKSASIGSAIYYPKSLHEQPCFAALGNKRGDFPVSEKACQEVLALPNFPGITQQEQRRVIEELALAFS